MPRMPCCIENPREAVDCHCSLERRAAGTRLLRYVIRLVTFSAVRNTRVDFPTCFSGADLWFYCSTTASRQRQKKTKMVTPLVVRMLEVQQPLQ